jgi:hypothetical protein
MPGLSNARVLQIVKNDAVYAPVLLALINIASVLICNETTLVPDLLTKLVSSRAFP